MSIWAVVMAGGAAAIAWTFWGLATFGTLHDLGPDKALRATFSPHFWRTGEIR